MKITKERLKRIVFEEMTRMEGHNLTESAIATDVESDVTEDDADMGDISEGIENITPENLAIVFQALGQMADNFAPSVISAALAMPLMDAIKYLRDNQPPKPPAGRNDY